MTALKADFRSDLLEMARTTLPADWGPKVLQRPDDDLLILFFDSLRRRPAVRPRRLWIADDFQCPLEMEQGWEQLRQRITAGEDLRPHLSRGHGRHDTRDGLLNEWDVHHFHLGTTLSPGDPFIERTGPVLFARVTANDFYAISVYSHGTWEDTKIIESLHRNWPDSIRQYRVRGIQGEPLTEAQRRNLRKGNLQTATATSDGTVYMAIGGGVVSSGTSVQAVMRADMLWSDADLLQKAVQDQFEKFLPYLRAGGYTNQTEVKATLIDIPPQAFQIAFPEYGVLSKVTLEGGWFHRRRWDD
jgi:hypothetical protein